MGSATAECPLSEGTRLLSICEGAPNFILDFCTEQLMEDGTTAALTEDDKKAVLGVVNEYSSKELRVLAIATQTFERMPFDEAARTSAQTRSSRLAGRTCAWSA